MIKYKVYFEKDSGTILALTNKDLDYPNFFEAFYEDIAKFIEGNENILLHKVVYNVSTSNYKIIPKDEKIEIQVNDLIHNIKQGGTYQIRVIKNNKKKIWKIHLEKNLKQQLSEVQASVNDFLHFSITQKNNPNVLYRYIVCTVKQLVDDDIILNFDSQEEENLQHFSVYTNRKFEKYSYEVVDV